jgi:hypothetical protein
VKSPLRLETLILVTGFTLAVVSGVASYRANGPYGDRRDEDPRVQRVYDPATGRLTMVAYDADGDLRLDRWCYMDGERLLRMDVDADGDGAVDRREYYRADGKIERTEFLDGSRVIRTEVAAGTQRNRPGN